MTKDMGTYFKTQQGLVNISDLALGILDKSERRADRVLSRHYLSEQLIPHASCFLLGIHLLLLPAAKPPLLYLATLVFTTGSFLVPLSPLPFFP